MATVVIAGAIALAVLVSHGYLRQSPVAQTTGIEAALTAGAPASTGAPAGTYVWLTGIITDPPHPSGRQGGRVTGTRVDVIDWTGKLRYHFDLTTPASSGVPAGIQSISADGTRALLDDGTLIDETGLAIGKIQSLKLTEQPASSTHWMGDEHICAAVSNEPVAPFVQPAPKGQPNASPTPVPPYALPGADHSISLKIYGMDGSVRTVATIGSGALGVGSGVFGDSASVLACSPAADLAVVARYHDADTSPADKQSTTNMTASLWAIKISTGAVLYQQAETRMALGRAFFLGSENGKLAVEFLWNSKVWGSETDVVLEMPSGRRVPVTDAPIPDTAGLSADGTRILRRTVDQADGKTSIELIDASNGRVIRRVVIPTTVGASAVAQPGSSSFMVQVENYLALVDGNGGISLLHPDVDLAGHASGPGSVALTWLGVQG
jgi:hypothetical protein